MHINVKPCSTVLARIFSSACWLQYLSHAAGKTRKSNPVTSNSSVLFNYSGPAAATTDVQAFRLNVWENLNDQNRCVVPVTVLPGNIPNFVRMDDINLAYSQANTIVDLSRPADSRMVSKVAGGHNCWLDSDSACGDVITAYIATWAGGVSGSGNIAD